MRVRVIGKVFFKPVFCATFMPLAIVIVIGFYINELVLFAVNANLPLNLTIMAMAIVAAVYALYRAWEVDGERHSISAYRHGLSLSEDDNSIDVNEPSGMFALVLRKLVISAKVDGKREFSATVGREIDMLRASMSQRLSILQYMTGLLISLGLLGTFLGLLRTLVSASAVLESVGLSATGLDVNGAQDVFSAMILSLRAPLTNMGTAFSSSLFGLVGSIMVGMMLLIVQRSSNANIGDFHDLVMTSRSRLFEFRTTAAIDGEVVQDILDAMLSRERLAFDRSNAVLEKVAHMGAAFSNIDKALESFLQKFDKVRDPILEISEWIRASKNGDEPINKVLCKVSALEGVLIEQNEILRGILLQQDNISERMEENFLKLLEGQSNQIVLADENNSCTGFILTELREARREVENIHADNLHLCNLFSAEGPYFAVVESSTNQLKEANSNIAAVRVEIASLYDSSRWLPITDAIVSRFDEAFNLASTAFEATRLALVDFTAIAKSHDEVLRNIIEILESINGDQHDNASVFSKLADEVSVFQSLLEGQRNHNVEFLQDFNSLLEFVGDLSAASQRSLLKQDANGQRLDRLIEEIGEVRAIDRSILENSKAVRDNLQRIGFSFDSVADRDKRHAEILENLASLLGETRKNRENQSNNLNEVRGDTQRLNNSLFEIEKTLLLLIRRIDRFFDRGGKD
jgi:biopolymer transport protein ExbB/TolQ